MSNSNVHAVLGDLVTQGVLTERDRDLVVNCLGYAGGLIGIPGGFPGHNLILLVAKLANVVVEADVQEDR